MKINLPDFCRNLSHYRSDPDLRESLIEALMYLSLPRDEAIHLINKSSDRQLQESAAHALALYSSTIRNGNHD